jgi:hypothetical protein
VKLAIADPPYLGRAARHYGPGAASRESFGRGHARAAVWGRKDSKYATTEHPDAAIWDLESTHRALIEQLQQSYDGWAVALWRTSLPLYLDAAPNARVAVWVKPRAVPGGSRIITSWEPLLFSPARDTRKRGNGVRDALVCPPDQSGHTGAKPRQWTRWALNLMGYEPGDAVDDLFPGSGAVSAELNQGVLS